STPATIANPKLPRRRSIPRQYHPHRLPAPPCGRSRGSAGKRCRFQATPAGAPLQRRALRGRGPVPCPIRSKFGHGNRRTATATPTAVADRYRSKGAAPFALGTTLFPLRLGRVVLFEAVNRNRPFGGAAAHLNAIIIRAYRIGVF